MSNQAHKGQILPLANQMIPISNETTFHASYDFTLYGFNQGELVRPIGPERALHFNGTTGYIDCGSNPMLSLGDSFTINIWVNPKTLAGGIIVREGEYGIQHSGGKFSFFVMDVNNTDINEVSFDVLLNDWSHISAIADKESQVINVYVNGFLSASTPYTVSLVNKNLTTHIGKSSEFYNGDIAMLSLYSRAFSQESVLASMMNSPNRNDTSLVAYWRLNEQDGPLSYDYASRAIDAVWVGGVTPNIGFVNATIEEQGGKFRSAVLVEPDTVNLAPYTDYSDKDYDQVYYATESWSGDNGTLRYYPQGGYGNLPYSKMTKTVPGNGAAAKAEHVGITIEAGKTYTVSAWMKADRNLVSIPHILALHRPSNNHFKVGSEVTLTKEWKRYQYSFLAGEEDAGTDYRFLNVVESNENLPLEVYWCGIQVEERHAATSYTSNNRPLGRLWYSNELINPTAFTVSFLFKIPKTHTYHDNNKGIGARSFTPIFEICSPFESGNGKLALVGGVDDDRRLNLIKAGTSAVNKYGTKTYEDGQWHHLVIRYDGTTYEVFLDGELDITHQDSFDPLTQNDVVMIGGSFYGKPNIYIDEVRIESRAISNEEMLAWAASGLHYNYLDYSF